MDGGALRDLAIQRGRNHRAAQPLRQCAVHYHHVVTTVTINAKTRDRLQRYGHAGMTYDEILQAMMDRIDEDEFVAEIRRLAAEADEKGLWVGLDEA